MGVDDRGRTLNPGAPSCAHGAVDPRLQRPHPAACGAWVLGAEGNRWIAAALLLVFLLNLAFILLDRRTFTYDDSWYAETALRFLDAWAERGIPGALDFFQSKTFSGNKAPLVILPPQPLLLIFGRNDDVFLLANALCLVVAGAYLAALARRIVDAPTAAALVVIFGLMPLTALTTHAYFVEVPLAALVLMFAYHAERSDGLTVRSHTLLAGLAFGLGMLAKVTFPVFVVGILALLYARAARRSDTPFAPLLYLLIACLGPALALVGHEYDWPHATAIALAASAVATAACWHLRARTAFNIAAAAGLGLWITLIWYLHNARTIVAFARSNSIGEISRDYGSANVLDPAAIASFWVNNINSGFGALFGAALCAAALLAGLANIAAPRKHAGRPALLPLIAAWIIPPVIIFTLGRNRTTRFLLPMLPALALLYGVLLQSIARRGGVLGRGIAWTHAALAVAVYGTLAFGGPRVAIEFAPHVGLVFSGHDLTEKGPATSATYNLEGVVRAAARVAPRIDGRDALVMLLSDSAHVNQNTLTYTAVKMRKPVTFGLIPYGGQSPDHALAHLERADVLAFQSGGDPNQYPVFTNRWRDAVLEAVEVARPTAWRPLGHPHVRLDDGSTVRFYERKRWARERRPEHAPLTPCFAPLLDGAVALVGYQLARDADGLHLSTCWLKLKPLTGRFVLAAHIITPDRSYQFNADHGHADGDGVFEDARVGETVMIEKTQTFGEWTGRATLWTFTLYDVEQKRAVAVQPDNAWGVEVSHERWIALPLPDGLSPARSPATQPAAGSPASSPSPESAPEPGENR